MLHLHLQHHQPFVSASASSRRLFPSLAGLAFSFGYFVQAFVSLGPALSGTSLEDDHVILLCCLALFPFVSVSAFLLRHYRGRT